MGSSKTIGRQILILDDFKGHKGSNPSRTCEYNKLKDQPELNGGFIIA